MTRRAAMISISKIRRSVVGALVGATLLLPWQVTAESSLQSGARTATVGASAHLDFKIVIPPVLALSVENAGGPGGAAPRVSIFSNSRHVLLNASVPAAGDARPFPDRPAANDEAVSRRPAAAAGPADAAARTVLLTAPRHFVINAETGCRLAGPRLLAAPARTPAAPIVDLRPVVCTVAMP